MTTLTTLVECQVCGAYGRLCSEVHPFDADRTITATARKLDGHNFTVPTRLSLMCSYDGETFLEFAGVNAGFAADRDYVATWPLRAFAGRKLRDHLVTYDDRGRKLPRPHDVIGCVHPSWAPRFYYVMFHGHDAAVECEASAE